MGLFKRHKKSVEEYKYGLQGTMVIEMDIEKFIIEHWLHVGLTTVTGLLSAMVIKLQMRWKATEKGVQALLRNEIIKTYNHYMDKGYLPIHECDNVMHMFEQYEKLGGNGTVPGLVEKLKRLPTEDEREV